MRTEKISCFLLLFFIFANAQVNGQKKYNVKPKKNIEGATSSKERDIPIGKPVNGYFKTNERVPSGNFFLTILDWEISQNSYTNTYQLPSGKRLVALRILFESKDPTFTPEMSLTSMNRTIGRLANYGKKEPLFQSNSSSHINSDGKKSYEAIGWITFEVNDTESEIVFEFTGAEKYRVLLKEGKPMPVTIESARNLFEAKNFDESEKLIAKIILKDSQNADAFYLLAQIYKTQGKLEQAIANCEKALLLRSGFTQASVELFNIYMSKGDCIKAQQTIRLAISADLKNPIIAPYLPFATVKCPNDNRPLRYAFINIGKENGKYWIAGLVETESDKQQVIKRVNAIVGYGVNIKYFGVEPVMYMPKMQLYQEWLPNFYNFLAETLKDEWNDGYLNIEGNRIAKYGYVPPEVINKDKVHFLTLGDSVKFLK